MNKIITIATLELKRMARNQMVWFIALISVFLLFLMDMFNYFTIEEQIKMIKDFSLGLMNIISLIIIIYYPVNMIKNEFMEKTIYSLLASPATRNNVILGKALAMAILLMLTLAVNMVSLIIMILLKHGSVDIQLLYAVILIYLKNLNLLGFVFLFSVLPLSNIICTILTVFVYGLGSVKSYFMSSLDYNTSKTIIMFNKIFFSFIPNLRIYDVVENITLGNPVTFNHILNCFMHFTGVAILVYCMAIFIFNKLEL